jgi:hypothetical protein
MASWCRFIRFDTHLHFATESGIRQSFFTQVLFLQVCIHHHHTKREFHEHKGMDPQESVHVVEDQQFRSG